MAMTPTQHAEVNARGARGGSATVKPRRAEPGAAAGVDGNLHVSARDLLEAVPDAAVGVDRDGRIAFVNVQTEQLFGYTRSEMLGQPVELLLPEHLKGAHARHREVYHANPTTRPMGARWASV
jgi:hypothetical protein